MQIKNKFEKECNELVERGKILAENKELPKIVFCCITQDRIELLKEAINHVYEYVDEVVIVDGGSTDGTIEYVKGLDKGALLQRKWDDNFCAQRDVYLDYAQTHRMGWWLMEIDDDEFFCKELMENIKYLMLALEEDKEIRILSIIGYSEIMRDGKIVTDPSMEIVKKEILNNKFKNTFLRLLPENKFISFGEGMHENTSTRKQTTVLRLCNTNWTFAHQRLNKEDFDIRNCRNYFVGGPWRGKQKEDEEWKLLRKICNSKGLRLWNDLLKIIKEGTCDRDLIHWFIMNKLADNESYSFYKLYFTHLHPEKRESYEHIEGWMGQPELEWLKKIASEIKNGVILEIGSWMGKSTVAMGRGCKNNNTIIYSVDPFTGTKGEHEQWIDRIHSTLPIFESNIKEEGLEDVIITIQKKSEEVIDGDFLAGDEECKFDFIFIDGGHTYKDVKLDFGLWFPLLKKNGIVAFHDKDREGPKRVIEENKHLLKEINMVGCIFYGKKS